MPRDRYDDEDDRDDRPRRRRDDEADDDDRPRRRRYEDDEDDEDDRPRRSRRRDDDFDRRPPASGNGLAVASLILGIVSLCFGPLSGLVGLILGLIALRKPSGRAMAIIGMVLSGLFTVGYIGFGVWIFLEGQKVQKGNNNLKQIGLATYTHESANGVLPRPYHEGPGMAGPPRPGADLTDRLSWRVSLLPYIEQESLFRQFNPGEPWNGPTNQPLGNTLVRTYSDVETPSDPTTRIRCFYGMMTMFPVTGRMSLNGVTDGTSNTIMYVESEDKVSWSRFQEFNFELRGPLPKLGKPNKPTFMVVMGDGSVRSLRKDMSEQNLRGLITANGAEIVDLGR